LPSISVFFKPRAWFERSAVAKYRSLPLTPPPALPHPRRRRFIRPEAPLRAPPPMGHDIYRSTTLVLFVMPFPCLHFSFQPSWVMVPPSPPASIAASYSPPPPCGRGPVWRSRSTDDGPKRRLPLTNLPLSSTEFGLRSQLSLSILLQFAISPDSIASCQHYPLSEFSSFSVAAIKGFDFLPPPLD